MASVPSELGAKGDKQDVAKIYGALHSCISKMPKDQLRRVVHIAVCGQMHGVVFWRQGEGWSRNSKDQLVVGSHVSALYTWQDGRCDTSFLNSLPYPRSHLGISTGYGCATIFWLLKNKPDFLNKYDRCGTVMDFVVAMMLDLSEPVTSVQVVSIQNILSKIVLFMYLYFSVWVLKIFKCSQFPKKIVIFSVSSGRITIYNIWYKGLIVQNAAGFGFFDCIQMQWNSEILEEANFPVEMLPKVACYCTFKCHPLLSHKFWILQFPTRNIIFSIKWSLLRQVIQSSESAGNTPRDWFDIPSG